MTMATSPRTVSPPDASSRLGRPRNVKRGAPRVDHFYRLADAEAAEQMGVSVRHLCGTWSTNPPRMHKVMFPDAQGRQSPESHECRSCRRVLQSRWRREMVRQYVEGMSQ